MRPPIRELLRQPTRGKKAEESFPNSRMLGLRLSKPHGSCVSSRKRFKTFSETETQT